MNAYIIPGIIRNDKTEDIINLICNYIGADREEVFIKKRHYRIVLTRQLIQYFLRRRSNMTYKEIGILFNQHHSTIISSVRSIENYLATSDMYVCKCVEDIENTILMRAA